MKVYYFASLKEALKIPSEEIILSADMTVAQWGLIWGLIKK
jgi:hypothetical protein